MVKHLSCDYCSLNFEVSYSKWKDRRSRKNKKGMKIFCSEICRLSDKGATPKQDVCCQHCQCIFLKSSSQIKEGSNNFCSQSCAATYNNTHKTKGTRRSKLEKWLEEQLKIVYPDLNILYSDKTTISSELDIYIPSLKLAFELNGIFHYEPIFGETKLNQIQNNDNRKFQACLERGIELCIIDTSQHKYVKPSTSQKYLDIILNIIDFKSRLSP